MLALSYDVRHASNVLIQVRSKQLAKEKVYDLLHPLAVWDIHIAVIRELQAAFAEALRGALAHSSFLRSLKFMNGRYYVSLESG